MANKANKATPATVTTVEATPATVEATATVSTPAPAVEVAIDRANFDAFLASLVVTKADGTKAHKAVTINTFIEWFDNLDGKRVRAFIRSTLKLNAPMQSNGATAYVFRSNDPAVKAIFDRFALARDTAGNTKARRIAYDENGFMVAL